MFKVNKNIKQLLGSADREKMKCFLLECRLEKRKKGKTRKKDIKKWTKKESKF